MATQKDQDRFWDLALEALHGPLSADEQAELDALLVANPEYAGEFSDMKTIVTRTAQPLPDPPAIVVDAVLQEARRQADLRTAGPSPWFSWLIQWRPALALGLTAVVTLAVGLYVIDHAVESDQPGTPGYDQLQLGQGSPVTAEPPDEPALAEDVRVEADRLLPAASTRSEGLMALDEAKGIEARADEQPTRGYGNVASGAGSLGEKAEGLRAAPSPASVSQSPVEAVTEVAAEGRAEPLARPNQPASKGQAVAGADPDSGLANSLGTVSDTQSQKSRTRATGSGGVLVDTMSKSADTSVTGGTTGQVGIAQDSTVSNQDADKAVSNILAPRESTDDEQTKRDEASVPASGVTSTGTDSGERGQHQLSPYWGPEVPGPSKELNEKKSEEKQKDNNYSGDANIVEQNNGYNNLEIQKEQEKNEQANKPADTTATISSVPGSTLGGSTGATVDCAGEWKVLQGLISGGKWSEAKTKVELFVSGSCSSYAPKPKVALAKARILAASGDKQGAKALLDPLLSDPTYGDEAEDILNPE